MERPHRRDKGELRRRFGRLGSGGGPVDGEENQADGGKSTAGRARCTGGQRCRRSRAALEKRKAGEGTAETNAEMGGAAPADLGENHGRRSEAAFL
jgi:hypothetical protein